jgi:hypothetical protein
MSRDSPSGDGDRAPSIEQINRSTYEYGAEAYCDPEVLRELYQDWGLSQSEIAEECNVTQQCIQKRMAEFGIETRPPMHERNPSISKSHHPKGKVQYQVPDGDGGRVTFYRHQLVALLCVDEDGDWLYTTEDIFGDGTVIHHIMRSIVAIDIPLNLAVLTRREHVHAHGDGGKGILHYVESVLSKVYDEYRGEPDQDEIPVPNWLRDNKKIRKLKKWGGRLRGNQPADDD